MRRLILLFEAITLFIVILTCMGSTPNTRRMEIQYP